MNAFCPSVISGTTAFSAGATSESCAAQLALVAPAENAEVPLITEGQKAFMDMPEAARREKMTDEAWRKELKTKTGYVPAKVKFAWTGGEEGAKYRIEIRRLPDGKVF